MIKRKTGPIFHNIEKLNIPEIEIYNLGNGVQVCEVNMGSQDIIKFELIHFAGRSVENTPLASRAVSSLLKDGCGDKTSRQIAEEIDYYGASIKTASNMDFAYTTIYTLSKHCDKIIPLIHEMYYLPTFPKDELEKFMLLNIQKLKEELTKNDVITYREVTAEIFGNNHAYGYNSTEKDYINLNEEILWSHYRDFYGSDNCHIFISGKINDRIRNLIAAIFGSIIKPSLKKSYQPSVIPVSGKKIRLTSKNEHQSAIKTGRKLFDKSHPDNPVFFLLNTLYGGYFGSRLMDTIREDKGHTYDIHSSQDQMLHDGCFYISTEAATEYVDPILKEIYHQMDILKQDKVENKELQMVKNYLMGNFMNMLDGPMNVSSFAKNMILTGKHPAEFNLFVNELLQTNAQQLIDMAQKYYNEEDFIEVVVSPN